MKGQFDGLAKIQLSSKVIVTLAYDLNFFFNFLCLVHHQVSVQSKWIYSHCYSLHIKCKTDTKRKRNIDKIMIDHHKEHYLLFSSFIVAV